jgi:hypothetical protein
MSKSRLRGGAKAHRRKVQERNNFLRGQRNRFQQEYQDLMMKQIEAIKSQMSGETETTEQELSTEQSLDIKI